MKNSIRKTALLMPLIGLLFQGCASHKAAQVIPAGFTKESAEALISKYEGLTQTSIDMEKSFSLYYRIDTWMGAPYKYGGNTRKGVDCSGFCCNIYQYVYSMKIPRSSMEQFKKTTKVRKRKLKEGNLVFFHFEGENKVSHVGIYLGNHRFVHASTKKGVCIDDLRNKTYRKGYVRGGRFANPDEFRITVATYKELRLLDTASANMYLTLYNGVQKLLPGTGYTAQCGAGGDKESLSQASLSLSSGSK